jgi:hypothetical protein
MKQKTIFLFFCMIFATGCIFSQKTITIANGLLFKQFVKKPVKALLFSAATIDNATPARVYLPPDFYITQIGFFCKQEIKFEKLTKVPFRFRLGSVEDCDRMEGKGNTR